MVHLGTIDIDEIEPEELSKRLKEFRLIDVRGADEFTGELGHIEGSELVTLGDPLESWIEEESEKSKPVVFICRSGRRSDMAARMAKAKGFSSSWNLLGGMIAWNQAGLPTRR